LTPEEQARETIDGTLVAAGWLIQNRTDANIEFDLCTIRTLISQHGSIINAGFQVDYRDRRTRKVRWELADQNIFYDADEPAPALLERIRAERAKQPGRNFVRRLKEHRTTRLRGSK
jgi:hypothetical protein